MLPLPYCQLLKLFLIFFVFTLPFVVAPELGPWTPVITAFTAMGFFGLDQVGVELEGPFGTDANDFPLLAFGAALCDDLDAIKRTFSRQRVQQRNAMYLNRDQGEQMLRAAADHLNWGNVRQASPKRDRAETVI